MTNDQRRGRPRGSPRHKKYFRLPVDLLHALKAVADESGVSDTEIIVTLLRGDSRIQQKVNTMNTFPCISIQQPWAYLICHGYKDIENRTWSTRFRGRILIHAGKRGDEQWYIDNEFVPSLWKHYIHNVLGQTHIEFPTTKAEMCREHQLGGIIGYATLQNVVVKSDSPWFRGKYGFVLADAQPLPFIPLRGQLGIFSVDMSIVPLAIQQKLGEASK